MADLDLIVLVPDGDYLQALEGLLTSRFRDLGIREIKFEIIKYARHDPGCFHDSPDVLRAYLLEADKALVIFDHEGSGQEPKTAEDVENDLRHRLSVNGWNNRAEVVTVLPELEIWIWNQSPRLDNFLGWENQPKSLREWMKEEGMWPSGNQKPLKPKEALEKVRRETRTRKSSALFRQLAEETDFVHCTDPAFLKLKTILRGWFLKVP